MPPNGASPLQRGSGRPRSTRMRSRADHNSICRYSPDRVGTFTYYDGLARPFDLIEHRRKPKCDARDLLARSELVIS